LQIQGLEFKLQYRKEQEGRKEVSAGCQWLMPVIPANWEAKIGRTEVLGQPGQIVYKTPSPK
jgi:hypothetical protein